MDGWNDDDVLHIYLLSQGAVASFIDSFLITCMRWTFKGSVAMIEKGRAGKV